LTLNLPGSHHFVRLQLGHASGRLKFASCNDGLADESALFPAASKSTPDFISVIANSGIRVEACLPGQSGRNAHVSLDLSHGRVTSQSHLFQVRQSQAALRCCAGRCGVPRRRHHLHLVQREIALVYLRGYLISSFNALEHGVVVDGEPHRHLAHPTLHWFAMDGEPPCGGVHLLDFAAKGERLLVALLHVGGEGE
jgi:hypothetical protein